MSVGLYTCIMGHDTEQLVIKSLGLKDNKQGTGTCNTIKMGDPNKYGLEAHLSSSVALKSAVLVT